VAKGDTTLKNVPRDTVSFGLMTALRVGTPRFSALRTTLNDNGEVKEDPLPRVVTAAIVNWHPWGYDRSKVLTWRDKGSVRLLAGGTLTPDFGVTVGAGYSPIKGLSVNVGQVLLFYNSPRTGVELDKPVPDSQREDPFKTAHGRSWIFGLSYSFQ
jgi:hypothetical protein